MKKVLFILFVIFSNSAIASNIIPLAIGNKWTFKDVKTGEIKYAEVVDSIELEGHTWFEYYEIEKDSTFYVRNTDQGQLEIDIYSNEVTLVLPLPNNDGSEKRYKQFDILSSVQGNLEVKVPAGKYHAHKYQFGIEEGVAFNTIWTAENIGPVKIKSQDEELVLIDYELH